MGILLQVSNRWPISVTSDSGNFVTDEVWLSFVPGTRRKLWRMIRADLKRLRARP
jgi:hypothetical protein